MKVSTVTSGKDYRVTTGDGTKLRLCLDTDRDMVTIYSTTHNLGGYRLERFGDKLSPANIRQFFAPSDTIDGDNESKGSQR